MKCKCGGDLIKFVYHPSNKRYAYCWKCHKTLTWKQYRKLQAEKIIEMVRKEETPE